MQDALLIASCSNVSLFDRKYLCCECCCGLFYLSGWMGADNDNDGAFPNVCVVCSRAYEKYHLVVGFWSWCVFVLVLVLSCLSPLRDGHVLQQ
jgi:hypothetical protein